MYIYVYMYMYISIYLYIYIIYIHTFINIKHLELYKLRAPFTIAKLAKVTPISLWFMVVGERTSSWDLKNNL